MDPAIVYVKTPVGDEAVRQSTRVVQRNLRMVLLQVDGCLSVEELIAKIGNQRLVEGALKELEDGGFITVSAEAQAARAEKRSSSLVERFSAISQFSTFGPQSASPVAHSGHSQATSSFSSFGKPIFPLAKSEAVPPGIDEEVLPADSFMSRFPLRRWLIGAAGLLLLCALGGLFLYPYERFRPAIEGSLSRMLGTQVKVGEVQVVVFPRPRLSLSDVRLGNASDSRIALISVGSPYVLLGKGPYRITDVELSGISLSANQLVDLPMFGARPMAAEWSIERVLVERATVALGDMSTPEFSGEVLLKKDGTAEKAAFRTADGGLRVAAMSSEQGVMLNMDALGWKPVAMPFAFDSMQAEGLLQKNRLLLQKVEASVLGGILRGNWLVDWSAGMVMAGEGSLSRLDGRKVTAAFAPSLRLEGDVGGALRMRATGEGWQGMLGNIEASLDAELGRGMLTGLDLGEVARRGAGAVVRSGATRFDKLNAHLDIAKGRVTVRGLQLDAGLMTASGRATVETDGRVDGVLSVVARSSVSSVRVPARISGQLSDMSLSASN